MSPAASALQNVSTIQNRLDAVHKYLLALPASARLFLHSSLEEANDFIAEQGQAVQDCKDLVTQIGQMTQQLIEQEAQIGQMRQQLIEQEAQFAGIGDQASSSPRTIT